MRSISDPVTPPITADADELAQIGYDDLGASIPGWLPSDGDFTTRLLQAFASIVAEWAILAGQVPLDIVRFVGTYMIGVPPRAATPAITGSTWTMIDTTGYTIPAGTQVGLTSSDGDLVAFTTDTDVTVAPGSSITATGGVGLTAVTPGAAANGLSGSVILIDNLAFVTGVTVTGATADGTDDETTDAYQQRYGPVAQLVAPRPITPKDYELFARVFEPGVARALALDGYDAVALTTGNERTITVAVVDDTGGVLSGGAKADLLALYEAKREINFVIYVIDPTYTTVDVTFAGKSAPGYDPAEVQARALSALQSFLSPANWGLPPTGDQRGWLDNETLRYQDAVTALNSVDGFDHYTSLTIGALKAATAVASTDVVTVTGHGYSSGDPVAFSSLAGGAGLTAGTTYYVRDVTTDTFKVAATVGGTAINITTDMTAAFVHAQGTTDITLNGPAALTQPAATISGVVTA